MTEKHYASIETTKGGIAITLNNTGVELANSENALKLTEFHFGKTFPSVFYIPRDDVDFSQLVNNEAHSTHCPIKGNASYFSLQTDEGLVENIAWSYENPIDHVADIKGHLAFDGKQVRISQG